MFAELECPKCDYIASTKQALERHLKKKYPCDTGKHVCNYCEKHFSSRSSLSDHKSKNCKGRVLSRTQLIEQIAKLTSSLTAIEENTAKAIVLHRGADIDDDDEEDAAELSQSVVVYRRPDLHLVTIGDSDVKHPQIYFFEAGPALQPLTPVNGVIIKFGQTDFPYDRTTTHDRDFGGGRLIDSVLCVNPKAVEADFKKWMKRTKRLIKAKTANKKTVDTELFVVKNQEEYAMFVNKAKTLAQEYERENVVQVDLVAQITGMREDVARIMASV